MRSVMIVSALYVRPLSRVLLHLRYQKLRNKMDTAREGGERGILDETRLLVNEHVVKNLHSASNTLFASNPVQYVQNFINEKTK